MIRVCARKTGRLALALATTILFYGIGQTHAQEVDLETFCARFPRNSRCTEYKFSSPRNDTTAVEVERDSLCEKFPENSHCQKETTQLFKLQLASAGEDDEWIHIEKTGNTLKMVHTTQVENSLVSGMFDAALGLIPVPLPFLSVKVHDWSDQQTNRVAFKPDSCSEETALLERQLATQDCMITGTNTIVLPEGTDIYSGIFTVEYQEKDLVRSVAFRVPEDLEGEPVNRSITFGTSPE